MEGKLRDWNNESSWDKSALMSIQRELSEFSTAYPHNFNAGPFPAAGTFSQQTGPFSQQTGPLPHSRNSLYPSEVSSAVSQLDKTSSFMRSSHGKHCSKQSMFAQLNSTSNFFLHSEFSPFQPLWRDHNRFPFQQEGVSGFMSPANFPKWYDSPMYKELTFEQQFYAHPGIKETVYGPQRKPLEGGSTVLQKASALEKRSESELAGHHPPWKRTQSAGSNRYLSLRPSTVSPTSERSRRGHDAVSAITEFQHTERFTKLTAEQSVTTVLNSAEQSSVVKGNKNSVISFHNKVSTVAVEQGVVASNTSTNPFNITQLLTPVIHNHQDTSEALQYTLSPSVAIEQPSATVSVEPVVVASNPSTTPFNFTQQLTPVIHNPQDTDTTSEVLQYALSPPLALEQPAVWCERERERRGATPEVRISSYKSRASGLLFNLKDNRKRVKSTYSPTKFKGLEVTGRSKSNLDGYEPRDTVIDMPAYLDIPVPQVVVQEEPNAIDISFHPHTNPQYSPSLQPTTAHSDQHLDYTDTSKPEAYQAVKSSQTQEEMVYRQEYSGYCSNRDPLTTSQNGQGGLSQFIQSDEISRTEHLQNDMYEQVSPTKPGLDNTLPTVSSHLPNTKPKPYPSPNSTPNPLPAVLDTYRTDGITANQTNTANRDALVSKQSIEPNTNQTTVERYTKTGGYEQVRENKYGFGVNVTTEVPPWKGEIAALIEKDKQSLPSHRAATLKQDPNQKYGNEWNIYGQQEKREQGQQNASGGRLHPAGEVLRGQNILPYKEMLPVPDHTLANQEELSNRFAQNTVCPLSQQILSDTVEEQRYSGTFMDKYGTVDQYRVNEESLTTKEKRQNQNEHLHRGTGQDHRKQSLYSEGDKTYTVHNTLTEREQPVQRKPHAPWVEDNKLPGHKGYVDKQQYDQDIQWSSSYKNENRQHSDSAATTAQCAKDHNQYTDRTAAILQQTNGEFSAINSHQYPKSTTNNPSNMHTTGLAEAELAEAEQAQLEQDKAVLAESKQAKIEQVKAELDKAEQVQAGIAEAELAKAELAKGELAKAEQAKLEQDKAVLAKSKQAKIEQVKAELDNAEQVQADIAKAELANAELAKAEQAKSELAQAKLAKAEQAKAELEKAEEAKTELAKAEQAKAEQVKPEMAKAEQAKSVSARAEKAKTELPKTEQNKTEQAKAELAKVELAKAQTEQAKADLAKAKLAKAKLAQAKKSKAEKVKSELAKTELAKVEKDKEELAKTQGEQAKAELVKAELVKAELVKAELVKAELVKAELVKAELVKAELVKAELVKAELVKAELAKAELAKAELAKTEQAKAETAKAASAKAEHDEPAQYSSWSASEDRYGINDILTTRDYEQVKRERLRERKHTANEAVSAAGDTFTYLNISAKAENKTLQPNDVSPISRCERVDRGGDDYNRLREKYGFSHAVPAKGNKQPSKDVAAADDCKKTPRAALATNEHERGNEGQWVYSESSKQFKLASQIESKTTPADPTVAMVKDVHPSSFRALSLKEKGQTKQEILTSKLKAHAEKEISAIKEKGFGKRDRLLSRNPTKHQEQRGRGQNGQEVKSVKNNPSRGEKQTNSQLSIRKEAGQSEHRKPAKTEASAVSDGQQSRASLEQAMNRSKVSDAIEKEGRQSKKEESKNEAISGDSLQIMGIMVTIREPSVNEDNVSTPRQPAPVKDKINMEKEENISNKNELSSGQLPSNNSGHLKQETPPAMAPIADESVSENEVRSIVTSKREDTTFAEPVITEKARVKQQTQLPEGNGEPKTECVISGSKQARSAPETTKKDPEKNDKSVRNENCSREIPKSYGRDKSQRETLLHDTPAVNDGRSAEVKSAKNKQLAETQPLLFKHSITARNANDYANNNHPTNESIGKADLAAVEMAKSSVIQGGEDISVQDGQVENVHIESITIHVVSSISEIDNHKTTESHSVTKHVSSRAEKPTGDNNVHIDSIAIRVVSGVSENSNVETNAKERGHNPTLPSEKVSRKPEVKPRQKVLPTVPTAIADYARLKVISTEEDSPPNVDSPSRKDGYFPMIQTLRSRCPVFTAEQEDPPGTGGMMRKEEVSVKEPEIPSKLNTEGKTGVVSSMEQEQRKKGMFRLREKEKQAISFNEAKTTEGLTETHSLKHDTVPQPEHATTSGYQLGYQSGIDWNQRLYQSQNTPLPARAIPSEVDVETRNPSFSQQPTQPTHVDMPGKDLFSPTEATQYMEKTHATQASLGDIYSMEKREERRERQREEQRKEERKTRQREEERMVRNKEERKEEERKVRWRDEERMVIARHKEVERKEEERREQQLRREEKKAEERRKRQREEEKMARQREEEKKEEERRATQREEEKMARQREEEKKEKERREQQCHREEENKEEEKRKEEERRELQRQRGKEEKEEERRATQREEERMARQREEEKNEKERREQQRQREEEKKEEERVVRQKEEEKDRIEQQRQKEEKKEEERRVRQIEEERKEELRRARQREEERIARQKEEDLKEEERREQQRKKEERARQREGERMVRQKEEERKEEERRATQIEEERMARQKEEERREQQRQKEEEKKEEERLVRQKEEEKDRIEQQRQKEEKKEEERRVRQIEEERKEELRRARQREEERITRQKEEDLKEEERREQQRKKEERARQREGERMVRQKEEERKEEERRATQIEEERMARQKEEEMREQQRQKEEEKKEEERVVRQKEEEKDRIEQQRQKEEKKDEERRVRQIEEERKEELRRARQREEERIARQKEEDLKEEERREQQRKKEERARQREGERMVRQKEEERKEEERRATQIEEERMARQKEEERKEELIGEQRQIEGMKEGKMRARQKEEEMKEERRELQRQKEQKKEEERRVRQKEEDITNQQRQRGKEEKKEERKARQREEERMARQKEEEMREEQQRREQEKKEEERMVKQKEEERKEERREQQRQRDEEKMARQNEKERKEKERRDPQRQREDEKKEEKQRARQRQREKEKMDALQYYSISSPEGQTRPRDIPLFSPQPSPRRGDLEDWESCGRPHLPTSPAPPSTRSNTSSPALGGKPTMFRVKDNTFRGSSLTKSVKPLFHKSFGEEFKVGSALWSGSEMGDEELERTGESVHERLRESAGTPVYHDSAISSHRLPRIRETQPSKEFTAPSETTYTYPYSRLQSRRNVALDDDDSRSMISNMSGDVESYATSVADLSDSEFASRGGYSRPDSACSFISDVGRPLGKPPTVPPKSEKALRRAKRLTTRRIKKESKTETDSITDLVKKPVHAVASVPSSPSELRSSNRHALASPHFAAPISLPLAPTHISSVPCSPTDSGSTHHPSFHASPHAKAPVSHPRVTTQVASVPSSPTHHHHAHPRHLVSPLASPLNVPQYHVDPYYPSPPSLNLPQHFTQGLTQKKVLQDPGSGQYFVVDMPVQVKTKTFFDPETRKYVQLNVRQSGQGGSLSQPQPQCYPQSLPEDSYTQPQPQTYPPYTQPQAHPASRPYVLYQGYPQRYQPMPVSSLPTHRSLSGVSALVSPTQDPQPTEESQGWAEEGERQGEGWNSQCCEGEEEIMERETYGQSYSQEQTPYMDTAHDARTAHDSHAAYDTHNQLDKGAVDVEDTNPAPHRDIITMSELEDFAMDSGDW
ncbi:titin homolog [Salvelinus fontinalis]|uniref:titin homolog n=1 Tax=Salvelinus fontinalis TaxID=8038 RepID=UPI0024865401|nr:titin homolog [Salvelinus fontinalis]